MHWENKSIYKNKIIKVTKVKIIIPLCDYEKDEIICYSSHPELIHLTIYKHILLAYPNYDDAMQQHYLKLIIKATDISEFDKYKFEEWDLPRSQINIFSYQTCNFLESVEFKQQKTNKLFDRINGDENRICRDYKANQSSYIEDFLLKLEASK